MAVEKTIKSIKGKTYSVTKSPYAVSSGGGQFRIFKKTASHTPYFFLQAIANSGRIIEEYTYLICQVITTEGVFWPTQKEILKGVTLLVRKGKEFSSTSEPELVHVTEVF
ncbi:MAG: hypothetical protein ABIH82_00725 [Candidatus Woesearchaeota archaeon]